MKALLLFHLRVGVRVAVRASAPLFSAILAWLMIQMYPAAAVVSVASAAYSGRFVPADILPVVLLAFLLPFWGASRLYLGLNGWMRHLPINSVGNRSGLALALITVQLPLIFALAILSIVAHHRGLAVIAPAIRWAIVLISGAFAALPVQRMYVVLPAAIASASLALFGYGWATALSIPLLLGAERICGPVRSMRRHGTWKAAGSALGLRIAWRALRFRVVPGYLFGLAVLGITWLFINNNELRGALAAGAARFGGSMAGVACISWLSESLAVQRPVWPLARSFPWSAARRVAEDALLLGVLTLPLTLLLGVWYPIAAFSVLLVCPLLAFRAAAHVRRIPERRAGAVVFIAEGFCVASILALLPWSAPFWLAAAIAAFYLARQAERRQKVTRWVDLHHAAAGDSSSWSGQ
jgi:hypothetical protein